MSGAAPDLGGTFTSFAPALSRPRRRGTALHFVAQGGRRYALKSFLGPDEGPEEAKARIERELAGIEAFVRAGHGALAPVSGPHDELRLRVDGAPLAVRHALVFPFVDRPVLERVIEGSSDPGPLLDEAGRRIGERHRAATRLAELHSDGSAHNIFEGWTWFDFSEAHATGDLLEAKAHEVLRFLASVVEVSPAGSERARFARFCAAYADDAVLACALADARPRGRLPHLRMWLRVVGAPRKRAALARGDTTMFRRIRTWRALEASVRDRRSAR